jgi:hypothetical protein
LISTSFLDKFRVDQKEHVRDLSRSVTLGYGSTTTADCPNCTFDYVSGSSGATFTNFSGTVTLFSGTGYERTFEAKSFKQRCPICGGVGKFSIPYEEVLLMHVYWNYDEKGDTYPTTIIGKSKQLSVKLKTDSIYFNKIATAKYFLVDGVRVEPYATPVVRSMQSTDGIVEIWCRTTEVAGP